MENEAQNQVSQPSGKESASGETVSGLLGPNVKKLVIHKMSLLAIPAGSGDRSLELGVKAMMNVAPIYQQARDWVETAIAAVKTAPDCPWTTDDEIAAVILKGIDERPTNQHGEAGTT